MMPTPDQIERARLVALWRKHTRAIRQPGTTWLDYDPRIIMRDLFDEEWPDTPESTRALIRPDVHRHNTDWPPVYRTIVNPPRPLAPPPDLELPDDFPY